MNRFIVVRATLYLTVTALLAWSSGRPFLFPSLGPTAYVLAFDNKEVHSFRAVVGGHACGIVGGLVSYYLLVFPYTFQDWGGPLGQAGMYLALGGVAALAITAGLMLGLKASHPPACATTLIISLGIMPLCREAIIILISVWCMYTAYTVWYRFNTHSKNSP